MPRFSPPTLTSSLLSAYSRQTGKKRKLYLGRKSLKLLIRKHTFHYRLFIDRKGILWWSSTLENKPHQWCWLVKKSLAPIFICSLVLLVEGIRARKALSVFWSLRISSGNYTFFFPAPNVLFTILHSYATLYLMSIVHINWRWCAEYKEQAVRTRRGFPLDGRKMQSTFSYQSARREESWLRWPSVNSSRRQRLPLFQPSSIDLCGRDKSRRRPKSISLNTVYGCWKMGVFVQNKTRRRNCFRFHFDNTRIKLKGGSEVALLITAKWAGGGSACLVPVM